MQARKAGIASAMAARSSFKDEEMVSTTFKELNVFILMNESNLKKRLFVLKSTAFMFFCITESATSCTWKCFFFHVFCRKVMCTRRPCRLSSTQYLALHHITLRCGRQPHLHTVTSVKDCYGELLAKACVVLSVGSNAMRSAKNYWMLTVYSVSRVQKVM